MCILKCLHNNWLEKDKGCGAKKEKQEVETFTTGKMQVER